MSNNSDVLDILDIFQGNELNIKAEKNKKKIIRKILSTKTGKPSNEEKQLLLKVLENCSNNKFMKLDTTTSKLQYIRKVLLFQKNQNNNSQFNDFSQKTIDSAIKRLNFCLKEHKNKYKYSFLSYNGNNMDDIEIAVDSFVDQFYGIEPDDDIYKFVYVLFLQNMSSIMSSCIELYKNMLKQNNSRYTESELIKKVIAERRNMLYRLLFKSIIIRYDNSIKNVDKIIKLKKSQLSAKDKKIYEEFKKKNGVNLTQMSFINSDLIMKNVFCSILDEYIYHEMGMKYKKWLDNFLYSK